MSFTGLLKMTDLEEYKEKKAINRIKWIIWGLFFIGLIGVILTQKWIFFMLMIPSLALIATLIVLLALKNALKEEEKDV